MGEIKTPVEQKNPRHIFYNETVSFGDDTANISLDLTKLQNNLTAEAKRRELPDDAIISTVRSITFTSKNAIEFHRLISEKSPYKLERLYRKIRSVISTQDTYLGGVDTTNEKFTFNIPLQVIANLVNERFNKHPTEVKQIALLQVIDSILRHESEHVLQKMDPKISKKINQESNLLNKVAISTALINLWIIALPTLDVRTKIMSIGGTMLILDSIQHYEQHYSYAEKEAQKRESPLFWNPLNTPIEIYFEKGLGLD